MKENQNIEWKESWRDEYLKWICGFANAQGGKIYIGKDDNGNVVGIKNAKKLLEDIPNKTKDLLGIIADINLIETDKGDCIEIIVESYPFPVNYKGQYHYRSGSTKQELKGAALDKFMLQKKGKKWDAVPVPNVKVENLQTETFDLFKKRALKSKRIEESVLNEKNEHIIENLQLSENNYLKRAAILLFHKNPENFITGAYIKIGYFKSDTELIFQDEIHGNLFTQIETAINLLFTKYIKAIISYEGIHRIETYEYPKDAVREALLNAISHKDYSSGIPVQISVYDDKILIWNEGQLPENWTIKNLLKKHSSKPYNPDIANAFFRSGYIESWGRGTIKIIENCFEAGLPKPEFVYEANDFWVIFKKDNFNGKYLKLKGLNNRQIKAVQFIKLNMQISNKEYQKLLDVSKATATRDLKELTEKYKLFERKGAVGAGTIYKLIGSIIGSIGSGDE